MWALCWISDMDVEQICFATYYEETHIVHDCATLKVMYLNKYQ